MSNSFIIISRMLSVFFLLMLISCTERKFTIHSKPENVLCEVNGRKLGFTPITVKYVENGLFRIRLSKEGYENYNGQFKLKKKWFNQFALDFIGEILPYRLIDYQNLEFTMAPIQKFTHDEFKKKTDAMNKKSSE